MRFSLKIVVSAVLALALTVPQASAEPTNHPSSSYVQKKAKKLNIKVEAKGDCAQNPATILITDSTTTCSIEISVTPPKRYADVFVGFWFTKDEWIAPRYLTVSRERKISETSYLPLSDVKTSAKGKASVGVLKTSTYQYYGGASFVITSATQKLHVAVTDAKAHREAFTTFAISNPIVVTFQQSIPASGCGYTHQDLEKPARFTQYPCS